MGHVKSRLARQCGPVRATAFLRVNLDVTARRLALDPRWHTLLAVAPDRATFSGMLPRQIARMVQGRGDLGQRMSFVMRAAPCGPVIIIGADIPAITTSDISAAFSALRMSDAVLGPAGDGGYWLVGLSARWRRKSVFRSVRWSSPHALADTLANLRGARVALTATKHDVDEANDLAKFGAPAQRTILTA